MYDLYMNISVDIYCKRLCITFESNEYPVKLKFEHLNFAR